MNELNQMVDVNQILNNIKEVMTSANPSSYRIISYLHDLRIKEEYQSLSDSDYYDIVGETFKLNPEYFMASIYGARKLYKHVDRKEMAKHIIKKYCLYDGEEILYECHGSIKQSTGESDVKVSKGFFFVTTHRIIAQGTLKVSGGFDPTTLLDLVITSFSGISKKVRGKKKLIESSLDQELPCYGYQFQIKNHVNLKKKGDRGIGYIVIDLESITKKIENISLSKRLQKSLQDEINKIISRMDLINARRPIRITLPSPSKDKTNKLFQVLCKDANQIVDSFIELHEMGLNEKLKRKRFIYRLHQLWKSEEYKQLSDSDYLDIVKEIYKLDPEFFMTSIYPEMVSWNFPSFLSMKEEVITLVDKLNKEFVPSKSE
ncbi:MAG: hypothetical protein JSV62_03410 [Promethearchaeota archaeon]|nr:MAG: hypothetical protein JSV62_03410 [Candidatus Lokiarchaeota archaeon]